MESVPTSPMANMPGDVNPDADNQHIHEALIATSPTKESRVASATRVETQTLSTMVTNNVMSDAASVTCPGSFDPEISADDQHHHDSTHEDRSRASSEVSSLTSTSSALDEMEASTDNTELDVDIGHSPENYRQDVKGLTLVERAIQDSSTGASGRQANPVPAAGKVTTNDDYGDSRPRRQVRAPERLGQEDVQSVGSSSRKRKRESIVHKEKPKSLGVQRSALRQSLAPTRRNVRSPPKANFDPGARLVTPKSTRRVGRPRKEVKTSAIQSPEPRKKSLVVKLKPNRDYLDRIQKQTFLSDYGSARDMCADMAALSKVLHARTSLEDKPATRGQPLVFAEDRQSLCETLMYYRSFQGACYMSGGLVYSMMFDENGYGRDFMDAEVVISRAGGGMGRDKAGETIQLKGQSENAQTRSMRKNMLEQIPIIILCGDKNCACPSKMPYKYCVLGFFKVTDIVHRKGNKATENIIQYRFEKLNSSKSGWWDPVGVEPVQKLGTLPPPDEYTCSQCQTTHQQVYLVWICLTPTCSQYWRLYSGRKPRPEEVENFNPSWLKKLTRWSNEEDPFDLRPTACSSPETLSAAYPHESTRGICCPKCGMCTSRYLYRGYKCDNAACKFTHYPQLDPTPIETLRDTYKPVGYGSPISHDFMESHIRHWHEEVLSHRANYFEIPGLDGNRIVHLIANQRVLEEPRGPDDMFTAMQESDIGLERNHLVTGKAFGRMSAFSVNHGYPYKFVGKVKSRRFQDAPWVIPETRTQLNFFSKLVLNADFDEKSYNELLTFAYLEGQKIKYHDDGESGLGRTVATYSLGAPATMRFRLKGKYYSGVVMKTRDGKEVDDDHDDEDGETEAVSETLTKSKQPFFLAEPPLPCSENYEKRKVAFESLSGLSKEEMNERCWALPRELGLRARKGSPPLITVHLAHGDKIIMHGEDIQKFCEHEVEPAKGYGVRFANTCRVIQADHLKPEERPADGEVPPDEGTYDGSGLL